MSILSSSQIKGRIYIENIGEPSRIFVVPTPVRDEIKDASIDVRLGNYFIVTKTAKFSVLDACDESTKQDIASYQERQYIHFGDYLVIHPGTFILGVTWEYIGLPNDIYAQVLARSTWGRAGITVATAVSVQPGFCGCLTLELVNNGNAPVSLYPGSRLAQMVFFQVEKPDMNNVVKHSQYCGMIEPSFSKLYDEKDELKKWEKVGDHISL